MQGKMKREMDLLEYRLRDVLEMNYSKKHPTLSSIVKRLLARPIRDPNLYLLPMFVLEDALVVIQDGDAKSLKELYLLNAHKKSFQIFPLGKAKGEHR